MIEEKELKEYMNKCLTDVGAVVTNGAMALTMVSLLVVLTYFRVPDLAFLGLLLIPIVGRPFFTRWVDTWLRNHFSSILEL